MKPLRSLGMVAFLMTSLMACSACKHHNKHETNNCTPATTYCPDVKSIERFPISVLAGKWYLYASTPVDTPGIDCSFFRTIRPCGCIGGILIPDEKNFSATKFAQQLPNTTILTSHSVMKSLENCENSALYQATYPNVPTPVHNFTIIGTDSGNSYLVFYICSHNSILPYVTSNSEPLIWYFSRTKVATSQSIAAVKSILKNNNISYSILEKVDHTNCNYVA